ncbi:hypothetical protein C8Q79DRAFT_495002 [Trametes meyenii]|nr:hypothetical protein C8Q79DRAFT_495002 [Trametes meyenii]
MIPSIPASLALVATLATTASAHIAFWHESMYGFNVTDKTYSYDNRPQVPLYSMSYQQWWFHGHLDHPPNSGDFFYLNAGGSVDSVLSCDKGATPWYNSSEGGDVGYGSNSPCPGAPMSEYHTTGLDDVKGCALAIAYKSDVNDIKPEDFVVFSVNHTCVWEMHTKFEVPNLPPCPEDGCHCSWNWIHSTDSGAEQIYMTGFKCKVVGDVGSQALGKPAVPRRCGADPQWDKPNADPGNCTIGAKTPMYWYQNEGNNMFEDTYHAPYYNDLYGFSDGAQHDIFTDGIIASLASSGAGGAQTSAPAPTSSAAPVTTTPAQTSPTSSPEPTTTSPTAAPPSSSQAPPPSSSEAPSSSEPQPEPTTPAQPEPESTTSTQPAPEPTTTVSSEPTPTSAETSATPSATIHAEPVVSVTSSSDAPSSTRRCKIRPTDGSVQAVKRRHARHLSGRHHAH